MKKIILTLLLIYTVNAQHIWYVNRDATGNNTGRSWADAWNSFDSTNGEQNGINWSILQAGDTIYVSGGADSTNYFGSTSEGIRIAGGVSAGTAHTFSPGDPVVICPAKLSGRTTGEWSNHIGDVYFTTKDNSQRRILYIGNKSNVKITGFTFYDRRTNPTVTNALVAIGNSSDWGDRDSLIYFENNHIIGAGFSTLIVVVSTKVTIRNCILEHLDNNNLQDQDPIGMNGGRGGHTVDRNLIILRNGSETTDAHRDGVQVSDIGFGEKIGGILYTNERLTTTLSNNIIIDKREEGKSLNSMVYYEGPECNQTFYVYNNIIVNRKINEDYTSIWIGKNGLLPYETSTHILNNTIITKGNGTASVINSYGQDTVIIKNNLLIADSTIDVFYNMDYPYWFTNRVYKEIDYNYYAEKGGVSGFFGLDSGAIRNWTGWLSTFASHYYDVHSDTGNSVNVIWSNKYDTLATGYYTTTGRDAGIDLSSQYPFLAYDILGNPRTGAWDMGALEYQDGSLSNNINVKSKIFLQGPFNTNSMNTNLSQNGLLPGTQPFNSTPWNYNGSESLSSGSTSSYVDWVLVELRNSSNPSQVVAKKAAILNNDGTLLNTDGSIGVPISNVQEGAYYIAVFQRNHLAVMSAAPVQLSTNSQIYDFTNAMNKAYGTNPMADLGGGKYGMFTGDGNSNGGITITDRNEVWFPQNGTIGYLKGDFNLDGGVTASDVNLYWNINNGKMTQVP